MPLDAEDIRPGPVFQGFDDAVGSGLCGQKVRADSAAALMMGAVYQTGGAIEAKEQRRFFTLCRVYLVPAPVTMDVGSGQFLDQIASEVDVEKLHSPADAEDRPAGQEKRMEKGKLRVVQFRVPGDCGKAAWKGT